MSQFHERLDFSQASHSIANNASEVNLDLLGAIRTEAGNLRCGFYGSAFTPGAFQMHSIQNRQLFLKQKKRDEHRASPHRKEQKLVRVRAAVSYESRFQN